jgi:hypothetical protein
MLDWEESQLLAEAERQRSLVLSPFRDTAAWYESAIGVARSTARSRASVAAQLVHLPMFEADLARGYLTWDHLRIAADHADSPNRDQVLDDQAHLARLARGVSAEEFRRRMADWAADLDGQREAGQTRNERQVRRRKLRRWRTREGMNARLLELDDEAANCFDRAVDDLVREKNRAEQAVGGPDERVSIERRRADAVLELIERSRAADAVTRHRARPTILALCDASVLWDELKTRGWCRLSDGRRITAQDLRRLACEADIIPITVDEWGVPLDMGRRVRLATEHQRFALRAIHETCAVSGCSVPFDWCEIHHLCPWEAGGRTDLANLVPLCGYHHHLVHDGAATVDVRPDRTVVITGFGCTRVEPSRRVRQMIEGRRWPRVPAR